MKVGICVKPVLNTQTVPGILSSGKALALTHPEYIINPFDEFAIEEALKYKENHSGVELVSISLGNDFGKKAVQTALAMGVDRAVYLKCSDSGQLLFDSLATARLLAEAAREESFDIIFMGKEAVDTQNGAVGIMLGELLHLPVITHVNQILYGNDEITLIHRVGTQHSEELTINPPCILTLTKGINRPRLPDIFGIMNVKNKPYIEREVVVSNPQVQIENLHYLKRESDCSMITGSSNSDIAERLVTLLYKDLKVI